MGSEVPWTTFRPEGGTAWTEGEGQQRIVQGRQRQARGEAQDKKKSRIKVNNAKEEWVVKPSPSVRRDWFSPFSFAKQAAGGYDKASTITMEADKSRIGFYTRALKKAASAVATGGVSHAQLGVARPRWMKEGLAGQTRGKTVLQVIKKKQSDRRNTAGRKIKITLDGAAWQCSEDSDPEEGPSCP